MTEWVQMLHSASAEGHWAPAQHKGRRAERVVGGIPHTFPTTQQLWAM